MRYFFKKVVGVFVYCAFLSGTMNISYAAETVCNNNGGGGWEILDGGITNLLIPFNFGDVSVIHDLNISTNITHTYIGDLTVEVTSPDLGTVVRMFERPGTAASDTAPVDSGPYGCSANDIVVTFDDEAASGVNIENLCPPANGGTFLSDDPVLDLSAFDGEDPTGNWNFYLSDSAIQDEGRLNEACIIAAFAAVTFDKWVSTNSTCSDNLDVLAVAPGTDVYFCYTVSNPSTETFSINPGDTTDNQGHNISALETTYLQNDSQTVIVGPIIAGSPALPNSTATVNNASITASFSTTNFTGTLVTDETATANVGDPILNTSNKTFVDINGGAILPGDVLEYTIIINETAGFTATGISIIDIVDANLQSINFTTLPVGTTDNTVGNNIDLSTITVTGGGSVTIVYEATINLATIPGTNIDNTATILHAGSGVTFDAIAPTAIVSPADLSTSTKTVLDVNGGSLLPGDLVRYTITIFETAGLSADNVQLIDVVDSNLSGINITNLGGGTNNSSGNTIDISNITVPANGNVTVIFEANVSGGVSVGTSVNNTAIITDTISGLITNAVAPTLVVNSSPTTGDKILYLDNANTVLGLLTRVAVISDAGNTRTNPDLAPGNSHTSEQLPFTRAFTIDGGSNLVIDLWLRRFSPTNSGSRTARVEIFNGGTGVSLGSAVQSWNVSGMQLITFTIPVVAAQNFAVGDFIRLVLSNELTSAGNIRMRTFRNGANSQILMTTSTVINLDEIGIYASPSPSILQMKSYMPNTTVYLRATVSDPFGFADISSVDITVTDPTPVQVFTTNLVIPVANPPAAGATAVFETPYLIPNNPDGLWTIGFTANEGLEGTVAHSASANMLVGTPVLTVSKNSQTILDPVNSSNYKSIPNSIVEYSVGITNTGFGYVDINTTVITDPITSGTTFYFGSPLNPANLIDGATASGLSFNFISLSSTADDIDFSNNSGVSYMTPSVDGNGFDTTVPPINFIRINPKGEFKGSDGSNDPSMQINFRVRVE